MIPDHPADGAGVRIAVRRGRWRALGLSVAGLALLVLFVVVVSLFGADSDALRSRGGSVSGVIVDLRPDSGARSGNAQVRYLVGGDTYTRPVDLGADAEDYRQGQTVTVHYERADPAHMTIDDEDNQPGWTVLPTIGALVGGLIAFGFGLVALTYWTRVGRIARHANWLRCDVDVLPPARRWWRLLPPRLTVVEENEVLPGQHDGPNGLRLRVTGWPDSSDGHPDDDVWWCATQGRRSVLTPDPRRHHGDPARAAREVGQASEATVRRPPLLTTLSVDRDGAPIHGRHSAAETD